MSLWHRCRARHSVSERSLVLSLHLCQMVTMNVSAENWKMLRNWNTKYIKNLQNISLYNESFLYETRNPFKDMFTWRIVPLVKSLVYRQQWAEVLPQIPAANFHFVCRFYCSFGFSGSNPQLFCIHKRNVIYFCDAFFKSVNKKIHDVWNISRFLVQNIYRFRAEIHMKICCVNKAKVFCPFFCLWHLWSSVFSACSFRSLASVLVAVHRCIYQ